MGLGAGFIHWLVNDEDLRAIGKAVSFIDAASASMIPVLPQGCCIVSGTAIPYPMRVQVDLLEQARQPMSFDRDLLASWRQEARESQWTNVSVGAR